jgi:ribose-phosphate pyrophosphokinase
MVYTLFIFVDKPQKTYISRNLSKNMIGNKVLILADPKGKAYDFAKEIYKNLLVDRTREYIFSDIEIEKFKDGELFVRIKETVRGKNCFFIQDSSMYPQDWIFSLAIINDALMRSSASKINNILPYLRYARQDRMAEPRTPISASVVAKILNQTERIITTDIHNPAITGAYNIPFDNLKAYPVIINHLKNKYSEFLKDAVLVAPDIGSAKKIEGYVKRLGLEIAIADKRRGSDGEVRSMNLIGQVEGKNAIIVDDMIDSGGTILKAVEILNKMEAKRIFVCATHGLFSNSAKEKLTASPVEKIIITDSIPQKSEGKFEVVSLTNLFSEAIIRISRGESLSKLYDN